MSQITNANIVWIYPYIFKNLFSSEPLYFKWEYKNIIKDVSISQHQKCVIIHTKRQTCYRHLGDVNCIVTNAPPYAKTSLTTRTGCFKNWWRNLVLWFFLRNLTVIQNSIFLFLLSVVLLYYYYHYFFKQNHLPKFRDRFFKHPLWSSNIASYLVSKLKLHHAEYFFIPR